MKTASTSRQARLVLSPALLCGLMFFLSACGEGFKTMYAPTEYGSSNNGGATDGNTDGNSNGSTGGNNGNETTTVGPLPVINPLPASCSSSATICVGANQPVKTLAAAVGQATSGNVIELLSGTYKETVGVNAANVTIRGAAGAQVKIDCTGIRPYGGKSCILAIANNLTIENLVITGARGPDANEACLRNEPGMSVTVRRVECYGSNDGILSGVGGNWLVEDSYFHDNGAGDGYSHNMYFNDAPEITLRRVISKSSFGGHALKSRAAKTTIEDSQLYDNDDANAADFPNGGDVVIRNTRLSQPDGSNGYIARHGEEGCKHTGHLVFENTVIENKRSIGYISSACSSVIFTNTIVPSSIQVQQP